MRRERSMAQTRGASPSRPTSGSARRACACASLAACRQAFPERGDVIDQRRSPRGGVALPRNDMRRRHLARNSVATHSVANDGRWRHPDGLGPGTPKRSWQPPMVCEWAAGRCAQYSRGRGFARWCCASIGGCCIDEAVSSSAALLSMWVSSICVQHCFPHLVKPDTSLRCVERPGCLLIIQQAMGGGPI